MTKMTFPQLTAAGLAATAAVGIAHQGYAALVSRRGHAGFERRSLRCSSGNIVDYHIRRGSSESGPTMVFEAGLMNSSASWLLVADHLDSSMSVVLYDRAGYRGSLRRCPEGYSLRESVDDLREVITASGDGPCVLVGHSLGGYLAHRAAASCEQVRALVLVDPLHPHELSRSRRQREGSRAVNLSLKLGPWSAQFGAGLLLDKNGLYSFADGSPHQGTLRMEISCAATWRAARREWDYSYPFLLDGGRPLDRLTVPVTVLAAASTLDDTPEQADLYTEYIASGSSGDVLTIPGSNHLSITGGPQCAPGTACAIADAAAVVSQHGAASQGKGVTGE